MTNSSNRNDKTSAAFATHSLRWRMCATTKIGKIIQLQVHALLVSNFVHVSLVTKLGKIPERSQTLPNKKWKKIENYYERKILSCYDRTYVASATVTRNRRDLSRGFLRENSAIVSSSGKNRLNENNASVKVVK